MKIASLKLFFVFCSLILSNFAFSGPYLNSDTPIHQIENVHRQAEAWATCAATWTILSSVAEEGSPKAEHFGQVANGAKMAIAMTYISDLPDDVSPERFRSTYKFTQTAMDAMTETVYTSIMADMGSKEGDIWVEDLFSTRAVCEQNLDGQQMYVDLWRNLATSGILQFD